MIPNAGTDDTQGQTPSASNPVPTVDEANAVDVGSDSSVEAIEYPEGQAHGVTIYVQLNDGNSLYNDLTDAQRDLNNERGENASSDNPHALGEVDASWTEGTDIIGFFSSKQEYGRETEHGFTNYYGQYLNLYEDTEDAKIANNPAKRQIRVHKRSDELVYPDGNEYSWPGGWITGEQREGTLLEVQASYISSPGEAIAHAFELIEKADLIPPAQLNEYKQPISETLRFRGLETHHRIHVNHEKDAIETLRDSARLSGREGDGRIEGNWQKGHHQIYGFETDSISLLGFDPTLTWEYGGDGYEDAVEGHYLKCYRHTNAERFAQSDPRAHPKVEAKARGAYPGPAWNAVKGHLDAILNAHVADWAGVPKAGLIEDDYHDGTEQATITTQPPTSYRINLRDYFKSTGLKKEILSLIVNNRTNSAKDILYTVIRLGHPASYDDLKEETGLTKRTLRKWVKRLEEIGVVRREQSGCMFVHMTDFVRDHLRGFIEKAKPTGDIKRAIKKRKYKREAKRRGETETTPDAPTAIMTDGGTDTPPEAFEDTQAAHKPPATDAHRPDASGTDPPPE